MNTITSLRKIWRQARKRVRLMLTALHSRDERILEPIITYSPI